MAYLLIVEQGRQKQFTDEKSKCTLYRFKELSELLRKARKLEGKKLAAFSEHDRILLREEEVKKVIQRLSG